MNSKVKVVNVKKVIENGKKSRIILPKSNFWRVFNLVKCKKK